MRTILVPTDFSAAASNALDYAMALARHMPSRLILFHVYHLPFPVLDIPGTFTLPPDIAQIEADRITETVSELRQGKGQGISIEGMVSAGFAADEIPEMAKEKKADLIVLGISTAGKLGHALFGSITTGVIEKTQTPLIIVPENYLFMMPERIGFACDFGEELSPLLLEKVRMFCALFRAKLLVINVENPEEPISNQKAVSSMQLESKLSGVTHSLHFPAHRDVITGLVEFEDHNLVDMLVMVSHHHSVISQIFHAGKTRKMIFHTHVPLLVLHE